MTKQDKLDKYRKQYPGYHLTGVKSMTLEQLQARNKYDDKSLFELYARPSQAKIDSWYQILRTYKPKIIYAVTGNSMTYSVLLRTEHDEVMHITRDNKYLVEIKG